MSMYELAELVKKWRKEELTSEQAIGQLILQFEALSVRVGVLEQYMESLRKRSPGRGIKPN